MRRRVNIWNDLDWLTVGAYFLLVLIGWFNIYAAVYNEEHKSIFDFSQRYGKQLIWIFAAVALIVIVFSVDINFYSFFAYICVKKYYYLRWYNDICVRWAIILTLMVIT